MVYGDTTENIGSLYFVIQSYQFLVIILIK